MASDITYSTNPSDWTQLEGVYISEEPVASQVEGADIQTVGMSGRCVRGPIVPTYINSPERFSLVYGGLAEPPTGTPIGEVYKALIGKQFAPIYVRRVLNPGAATATHNLVVGGTPIARVDAANPGAWGNFLQVAVEGTDTTKWNLRVKLDDKEIVYEGIDMSGVNDNSGAVVGEDDETLVRVTKLANGRPTNAALANLTGGLEGTLVDADYIAGITDIAHVDGVAICLVPEASPTQSALNAAIVALAAEANDRVYFTWSGVHGNTPAAEITAMQAQITTPSPRIYWFYNSAKVLDPLSGSTIEVAPHTWAASILSRNPVDCHIGALQTLKQTAGVVSLRNEALRRADLIDLRKAGICSFEKQKRGFRFRSGIATDGTTRLVDRRERDWLQISAGDFLAAFVDEPSIPIKRAQMVGGIAAFSDQLKSAQRVIEDYTVKIVTTETARARNVEEIQWNVRLIGHTESIVLKTNIATGVVVDAGNAPTPALAAERRGVRLGGRGGILGAAQ